MILEDTRRTVRPVSKGFLIHVTQAQSSGVSSVRRSQYSGRKNHVAWYLVSMLKLSKSSGPCSWLLPLRAAPNSFPLHL